MPTLWGDLGASQAQAGPVPTLQEGGLEPTEGGGECANLALASPVHRSPICRWSAMICGEDTPSLGLTIPAPDRPAMHGGLRLRTEPNPMTAPARQEVRNPHRTVHFLVPPGAWLAMAVFASGASVYQHSVDVVQDAVAGGALVIAPEAWLALEAREPSYGGAAVALFPPH